MSQNENTIANQAPTTLAETASVATCGIIGFVGTIPPGNELMANLGTAVSLLLPADAVWRGASYHILPPSFLVASSFAGGGGQEIGLPFGSTTPIAPAMLAWALAYPVACLALAVAAFRRRDL